MKRIFETRHFSRWAKKAGLPDVSLVTAVREMEKGLIDADLGSGLLKKRVGLGGKGKSGGARTLVATNRRDSWIFLYGFKKNERGNVTSDELEALKDIAADLLGLSAEQISVAVADGVLKEIVYEQTNESKKSGS